MSHPTPRTSIPDFSSPNAQPFDFQGGDHGVLLIHGFTACPAQFRPLGELLHAQGFSVRAITLPGHGTSPQDMNNSTWQDWLNAVRNAAQSMRQQYAHFSVAGLSMGGVLALILAQEMALTSCTTLAAPMGTASKAAAFAGLLYPFYPTVHSRPNPARAALMADYDLGYTSYPTRKVADLNKLIRMARRNLHQVTCPLLSIQSHQDKAIIPESMDIIQASAKSAVKQSLWLQDPPHVIILSSDLPLIAQTMTDFLRKTEVQ